MEPGSGEDDFETQLRIEHPGGVEYFGLPGKWVTRPERYVMMDLGRGNNVERILHMKDGLSEHGTDIEFLRDIAKAIAGMFTVNAGLMYDTTYLVAIPTMMAGDRGWSGLPEAPHPLDGYCELTSIFVQEDRFDDMEVHE